MAAEGVIIVTGAGGGSGAEKAAAADTLSWLFHAISSCPSAAARIARWMRG